MAFCVNCGGPLYEGDRCCGNCGRPVARAAQTNQPANQTPLYSYVNVQAAAAAPPPKAKGRKGWIIALVAVAIVAAAAVVTLTNPKVMILRALNNTKNVVVKSELVSGLSSVVNGGSVEVLANLDETFYEMGYDLPLNISMKSYFDASDSNSASVCSAYYNGSSLGDLGLYTGDGEIALDCELLLPQPYGIKLDAARANLSDSIFSPDSNTNYALTREAYDSFMSAFKSNENDKDIFKKLPQVASKYMTELVSQVSAEGEFDKSSRTVTVGSGSIDTTAVTVTLGADELCRIVTYMNDYVQNDPDIHDVMLDVAYLCVVGDPTYYGSYSSLDEIAEELFEEWDSSSEDAVNTLGAYPDDEVKIVFYISKSGNRLVELYIDSDAYIYEDLDIDLVLGKDPFNTEELSLTIDTAYFSSHFSYYVDTDSDNEYSSRLDVNMYSQDVLEARFYQDKNDGDFSFALSDYSDEVTVDGRITQDKDSATIELDDMYYYDETLPCNLTVRIEEHDDMPSMPNYTDILTVSEGQMDSLCEEVLYRLEDFETEYENLYYLISDLLYSVPAAAEPPAVEPSW